METTGAGSANMTLGAQATRATLATQATLATTYGWDFQGAGRDASQDASRDASGVGRGGDHGDDRGDGQGGGQGGDGQGEGSAAAGHSRHMLAKKPSKLGALLATIVSNTAVVRVTHRPGSGPGKHAYQRKFDDRPFPLNRGCVVTFEAKFDRGFEWGCRGKVGGLKVGPGASDGGDHSRRGASVRLMWDRGGGAYAYVYVPSGTYDQQPSPLDERVRKGQSVFKEDFSRALVGTGWHTVAIGLKLNTVTRTGKAKADGELFFAIDGKERTLQGVVWRVYDTIKIENFVLGVFHGGGCRAQRTSHSNYRNIRVHSWAA